VNTDIYLNNFHFHVSFTENSKYNNGIKKPKNNIEYHPGKLYLDNKLVRYIFVGQNTNNDNPIKNNQIIHKDRYFFLYGKNNNIKGSNAK
jgi:hypothetical protein